MNKKYEYQFRINKNKIRFFIYMKYIYNIKLNSLN